MSLHRTRLLLDQGDPGLFDVLKRIGGAVSVGFTSGPIAGARTLFSPAGTTGTSVPALPPPGTVQRPGGAVVPILGVPGVRGALERVFPGGATGLQVANQALGAVGALGPMAAAGVACPTGFHPNKSAYMTQMGFVAKGSRCVRNRRRNLSNGRANSRALRRLAAWDKQERKRSKVLRSIARK